MVIVKKQYKSLEEFLHIDKNFNLKKIYHTGRSILGRFRIVVIFRTIRGSVDPDPDSTFGSVFFLLLGDL
jgi:hypothetical protein